MKRSLPVILVAAVFAVAGGIYWQARLRSRIAPARKPTAERTLNLRPDLSPENARRIRVNLTPNESEPVRLAVDGSFVVRPIDDVRELGRGERLGEIDVATTGNGFRLGNVEYRASQIEIVSDSSPAIWVNAHKYRGTVRLYRRGAGKILVVNSVPLEDYIASVIDSEMPAAFPDEARRAQAVVSRTYALYQMKVVSPQSPFDVYATTRSQKYLGVEYRERDGRRLAGESPNSRQIALDTAGTVCTWQGQLFCTYYSAVCGGRTTPGKNVFTDAAEPCKSVACQWCSASEHFRWTAQVSKAQANTALKRYFDESGKSFGRLVSIRPSRGQTPFIPFFEVNDGRSRQSISSVALVRSLPPSTLPSPRFAIKTNASQLIFEGQGHGHGVGLCQWGARGLAISGRNFREILEYYYPGATVVTGDTGE